MRRRKTPSLKEQIEVTAALWLSLGDRGLSAEERVRFDAWLAEDSRHRLVYDELAELWGSLEEAATLSKLASTSSGTPKTRRKSWSAAWTLPAFAGLAAVLVFLFIPKGRGPVQVEAPVAVVTEAIPRQLALSDGSRLAVAAFGELRVCFRESERRVFLLRGEAEFTVAKDRSRPFVVGAGDCSVTAVGTAFRVTRTGKGVRVCVTEGVVRIDTPHQGDASAQTSRLLRAGESLQWLSPDSTDLPETAVAGLQVNPSTAERLDFEDKSLGEIVVEFNRRQGKPRIVLLDPALASLRLGGSFRLDAPEAFVSLLEDQYGVVVQRSGDELRLRGR